MSKKSGNILKHYKRKKFFYRLFMRKSPGTGAMFGLSWMICFGAILPLALWFFMQMVSQTKNDSNTADIILRLSTAVVFLTACFLIYAYGFLAFSKNFHTILRSELKKSRWWKIPAFIGAFSWELAGMFLLPVVLKKRRWLVLIPLLCSFGFVFAGFMLDTPLEKWQCFHSGQAFMLYCAIGACCKKEKIQKKAAYPLFGFGLFVTVLLTGDLYFFLQIDRKESELAKVAKCGISAADWKYRNNDGYSINKEPLKSFCKLSMQIDMEKYKTPADAQKFLAELRKTHNDKFVAIDRLLELKPQRISYNWVKPGETVAELLLPDLQCFRTAARLRNLEILANAKDKALVAKCNQDMLKFREWCFYNETLIGKLVAGSLDNIRLDALSYAMASGIYSKTEIEKFIGNTPDWSSQISETFASENAIRKEFLNILKNASAKEVQKWDPPKGIKTFWKFNQKFAPLYVRMNLKRDYLFSLNYCLKINSLLYREDLSGLKKRMLAYLDKDYLQAESFIVSLFLIPALDQLLVRIAQNCDTRQMTLLAAEVMEYRKQQGKLPDDLTFLPEIPLSKLDHKPLMYEKTDDGFRIYSYTEEGKIPDTEDINYSYYIKIPKIK